ncbi:hypothetical protein ALC57_03365 [Trachymyrmex cornetzi]|uniref:Ig-like domain-containing protein n=1 Tax=Trachymyrmex cornetzi TaxID=471704 RepID=A0A195EFK2_9HYME|nr:hypothetical protein ALC57_03365 [Trachymyrmex cornetzi]
MCVPVPVESIQGVAGQRTILPCDIQPCDSNDAVSMVLWFKEDSGEPLYSERRCCRYRSLTTLVPRPLADSNARYYCGATTPSEPSLRAPVCDIDFAITEMGIDTTKVEINRSNKAASYRRSQFHSTNLLAEIATKTPVMGATTSLKSCGRAGRCQSGLVQVFSHHCGSDLIRFARLSNGRDSAITENVGRRNIEIVRPDDPP